MALGSPAAEGDGRSPSRRPLADQTNQVLGRPQPDGCVPPPSPSPAKKIPAATISPLYEDNPLFDSCSELEASNHGGSVILHRHFLSPTRISDIERSGVRRNDRTALVQVSIGATPTPRNHRMASYSVEVCPAPTASLPEGLEKGIGHQMQSAEAMVRCRCPS
jgi:hypothetical protein